MLISMKNCFLAQKQSWKQLMQKLKINTETILISLYQWDLSWKYWQLLFIPLYVFNMLVEDDINIYYDSFIGCLNTNHWHLRKIM